MDSSDGEPWESAPRGYVNLLTVDRPTSMWPRRCLVAGIGLLAAGASAVMLFDRRFAPEVANRTHFGKATENLFSASGFAPTTAEERVSTEDGMFPASSIPSRAHRDIMFPASSTPPSLAHGDGTVPASSIPSLAHKDGMLPSLSMPPLAHVEQRPAPVVATGAEIEAVWATTSSLIKAQSQVDALKATDYQNNPSVAYHRGDTSESQAATSYEPAPEAAWRTDDLPAAKRVQAEAVADWRRWRKEFEEQNAGDAPMESVTQAPEYQEDPSAPSTTPSWTAAPEYQEDPAASSSMQGTTSRPTTVTTVSTVSSRSHSLFCWALMMPHGYEVSLVRTLLNHGAGIFTCEDWTVFSEGHVELSPGPPARIITEDVGSVKCDFGGPWHLAMNSKVFIKVWRKVFADKRYLKAGWTVKVDPDAVFLPARLRAMLVKSDPDANVYFNNCDQGLHGPIEILARGGMEVFRKGIDKCVKHLSHEFDQAGEDVFLRHCLGLLNVSRVDNFHLLSEDRCMWENPVKQGCVSGKVAFHPFKKPETYFHCLQQAKAKDHRDSRARIRAIMK